MAKPATPADAATEAILGVVASIPRGKVTTYGIVAERAGLPRRARLVGRVLAALPAGSDLPWHRVVAAGGRIAFPAGTRAHREQARRLRSEGVPVANGRAAVNTHGWGSAPDGLDRWLWMVGTDQSPGGRDEN